MEHVAPAGVIRLLISLQERLSNVSGAGRYAIATCTVAAVCGVRLALDDVVPELPYLLFFPAIWLSAFILDHGSGVYATLLSAALALFLFTPPEMSFQIPDANTAIGLALFVLIALGGAAFIEVLRNTLVQVATGERQRDERLVELNHRIRNDLQLLAGLMSLRARALAGEDPAGGRALREAADRVGVLGKVYRRLHRPGNVDGSVVDIREYLNDLCADLQAQVADVRPIEIAVRAERALLSHDRTIPVGLIVNELITNALKYAFPDGRSGKITISFHLRAEGQFELIVADDGIGMANSPGKGTGQRIVAQLARQLDGTIERQNVSGSSFLIRFPETTPAWTGLQKPD